MSLSPNPDSIAAKKRRMTLNFAESPAKHVARGQNSPKSAPFFPPFFHETRPSPMVLTSPDLRMFTISTPEVERMLMQGLIGPKTPSPTGSFPGSSGAASVLVKTPTSVAEERDLYTKGFADAMAYSNSLHAAHMNSVFGEGRPPANYPLFPGPGYMVPGHQPQPVSPMHGFKILPLPHLVVGSPLEEHSFSAFSPRSAGPPASVESHHDRFSHSPSVSIPDSVAVSECAQTVPSPGGSSVSSDNRDSCQNDAISAVSDALLDVDNSCRERNDVRRERNRIAAARCRQRKVDRIWILEDRVKELRHQNEALQQYSQSLRMVLQKLKTELRMHLRSGCQVDFEP